MSIQGVPLCRGCGLHVRVFPFNGNESAKMVEELFGHENRNDEEPLAIWMTLKMRQQLRVAMCH